MITPLNAIFLSLLLLHTTSPSSTTTTRKTNYHGILQKITGNNVNPTDNKLAPTIAQTRSLLVQTLVGVLIDLVGLVTS